MRGQSARNRSLEIDRAVTSSNGSNCQKGLSPENLPDVCGWEGFALSTGWLLAACG